MGVVYVTGKVSNEAGEEVEADFLVDSGASYTLLRRDIWRRLGLEPRREVTFRLADGTEISRSVSECKIELPQGRAHTPVILGEEADDENLLGVVTLEILGFVLDPLKREIRPARMIL